MIFSRAIVVTDTNGEADIATTSVVFYRTSKGSSCTPDKNGCYILTACTFNPAYGNSIEVAFNCPLALAYWIDTTADGGRFGSDDWTAFVTVRDPTDTTASLTKVVEVNSHLALNIPTGIDYGIKGSPVGSGIQSIYGFNLKGLM